MKFIGDLCLRCAADYERVAFELFEDLAAQNVIYAEISYDPNRGVKLGIPPEEIMEHVMLAKHRAEKSGRIKIGLILGFDRDRETDELIDYMKRISVFFKKFEIIGIDLHGSEKIADLERFKPIYETAAALGLGLRAHAGESRQSENIWNSINQLHATRIAHGIGAAWDDKLLKFLEARETALDVSLSSNYMLGIIDKLEEHPIRKLYDLGLLITINTDDPLYFHTTLTQEYALLLEHLHFNLGDIKQMNLNAVHSSFADTGLKQELLHKIESGYAGQ